MQANLGRGVHSTPSASWSLKPQFHPKGSVCPHLPSPLRGPQHGQLGGCYLMPSAAPNRPKPDAGHLGHPGRSAPIPLGTGTRSRPPPDCRSGRRAAHPARVPGSHTAPGPHRFPAELAQAAVKPSAVHPAPEPPPGAPGPLRTPAGAAVGRGPAAPSPLPSAAAPRSRRRRRRCPNIWRPRPTPGAAANGPGGAAVAPPPGPAGRVSATPPARSARAPWRAGSGRDSPAPRAVELTLTRCVTRNERLPHVASVSPLVPDGPPAAPSCGQSEPDP